MLDRLASYNPGAIALLALAGVVVDLARDVLGIYEQVLHTDPVLLVVALTFFLADLPLGLYRGLTAGGGFRISRFRPDKAGDWAGNFLKYTVAVALAAVLAGGLQHVPVLGLVFAGFDEAVLLGIIILNAASVFSHLFGGSSGVRRFFARIRIIAPGSRAAEAAEAFVELVEREDAAELATDQPQTDRA